MQANDLIQPLSGLGTQKVKEYFDVARKNSPCIIFIDEIDSLSRRDKLQTSAAHLNQLLTEMDGFEPSDRIMIVAATNREDMVDPALKRSGRFDLKINIPLPWRKGRQELIQFFVKRQGVFPNFSSDKLAKKTAGFSPADLKNLVNLAVIDSIRKFEFRTELNRNIVIGKWFLEKNRTLRISKENYRGSLEFDDSKKEMFKFLDQKLFEIFEFFSKQEEMQKGSAEKEDFENNLVYLKEGISHLFGNFEIV